MEGNRFDLIVIGGGPGGYSAAITAAKEGMSVLLFEGRSIGGTCLNEGCVPAKYLLDKAAAMEKIRALTKKEIIKEPGLFSFKKIQKGREEVIRKLTGGVEYLLKANKVQVIRGFASLTEAGKAECEGKVYEAEDIIIATGSESMSIPIPGAEYTINSAQALSLERVPKRLAVIGGGVIGMELASAYSSYGSEVTVLEALPSLFPAEDERLISYVEKELVKRGIRICTGCRVKVIEKAGQSRRIFFEGEEPEEIYADAVISAAGRRPVYPGIDTEKLGIALTEKKEIQVDAHMQTNVPHIYAIGDAIGGYQLAHAAYAEGEAAVGHILESRKMAPCPVTQRQTADSSVDEPEKRPVIPRCIYTIPPYAAAGLTQAAAKEQGMETVRGEFAYSGNGMALAEGAEGLVQVIMEKETRTTVGIQIAGEGAPELLSFATLAVKNKMTFGEWQELVVAHPSLSEMIKEAALDCFGRSVHGPVRNSL